MAAAQVAGCDRHGGVGQLCEELVGAVIAGARPARPAGHGSTWELLERHRSFLAEKVEKDLRLTKISELLTRQTGVVVPYPTLRRFAVQELGFRRSRVTVRVADPEPGREAQTDFGRMGLVPDGGRQRVAHALIVTACYSRNSFAWLTFRQTLEAIIEGLDAAWVFFGGFSRPHPRQYECIVAKADPVASRLTVGFTEYAQARGFVGRRR